MLRARCKYYWGNGHPIGGGCPSSNCLYVHPDSRELWHSLPSYKAKIRCKHYDNDGSRLSDCLDGRNCRFVHPDDPSWPWAEPTKHLPRPKPSRMQGVSERLRADTYSTSRESHPTLYTGVPKKKKSADPPSPKASSGNVKEKDTPLPANFDPHRRGLVSGSTSARSSAPIGVSSSGLTKSPSVSSSALPQTAGELKHQALKDLISSLAQAVKLRQELRNAETRMSLRSVRTTSTPSTSNNGKPDHLLSHMKAVEQSFDSIVTRLTEVDFWPVPSLSEAMAQLDRRNNSIAIKFGELTGRLDRVEARLVERAEARAPLRQGLNASSSSAEMMGSASHLLKHHRISVDGSLTRKSDVMHAMDRLDRMEQKLFEVEEGDIWYNDQIAEVIEKLIGKLIGNRRNSLPVRVDDGSGLSRGNRALEPVEALAGKLERNFAALCDELADHLPTVGKLQAQLGQLHLDQADAKQTMVSLESSCEQLRERLGSMSRLADDLSSEIRNWRGVSDSQPSATEGRDYIIGAVRQDVKDHIFNVQGDLVTSHFKDAQDALILNFESTMMKTDKIYNAMSS